jgi:hypothetical protein
MLPCGISTPTLVFAAGLPLALGANTLLGNLLLYLPVRRAAESCARSSFSEGAFVAALGP